MIQADTNLDLERPGKELKGWHVLLIMLGFFGVMFAVNGVFLFHAITSFPGEDIKKSYVQGLTYNATLAERAAQADLGWRAEAGVQDNQLIVRLRDSEGQPLSNQLVIGELRRLATHQDDQVLTFQPKLNGEYAIEIEPLATGQWLLRVSVLDEAGEEVVFRVEKTLLMS